MDNENKIPETPTEDKVEHKEETKEATKAEVKTETEAVADCCDNKHKKHKTKCTPERKRMILLGVAIAVVLVILVGYKFRGADVMTFFQHKKVLTVDQAKTTALDFINKNLVQPGTKVDITTVTPEGSLYKLNIDVSGQKITAYMTNDGSQFFPTGMDMNAAPATADKSNSASAAATPAKAVPKSAKPDVKLFVMSYCPYGTQMEKGILPAIAALGNNINFTLEFVDYSMHNNHDTGDRKELDENMRQYCIQKLQPTKLEAYLTCFLKVGQGTENACLASAGIAAAPVASCMQQTDTQFNVTKDFNDKSTYSGGQFPLFEVNGADNTKYGVQGSPTLVINDTTVDAAGRDSASLLKTICSAFTTPPAACQTQLSTTAPAAGFGTGTDATGATAGANCGS